MATRDTTFRIRIAHWPALNDPRPLAIEVRSGRGRLCVEFRGPPYEHKGWWTSPAGRLHEALTGPHASMLHAGDAAIVLPKHDDHEAIATMMEVES